MLPLKLVRSLVLGETINNNPHHIFSQNHNNNNNNNDNYKNVPTKTKSKSKSKLNHDDEEKQQVERRPLLIFLPTKEVVTDTYRLATIARDMGMDLHPTPSLSHIIFSYPSSSSSSSSSSPPLSWSSLSLSSSLSWVLPNDAVLLTFPSLTSSSLSHLRSFVALSNGLFKLVFASHNIHSEEFSTFTVWDCCSVSLFSRITGERIDSMEAFCRALTGTRWTLYKTNDNNNKNPRRGSSDSYICGGKSVYLFRKVDFGRVRARSGNGECRIRELRLPTLDFRNAPLRILQYVVLMTDDVFYLS